MHDAAGKREKYKLLQNIIDINTIKIDFMFYYQLSCYLKALDDIN